MKRQVLLPALVLGMAVSAAAAQVASPLAQPVVDASTEHAKFIKTAVDGGLPPVLGVESVEVYHATHSLADDPFGKGYTYDHHVDMAVWKGRLYVGWTNGKKDEDVAPAHEVFATSMDGSHWSKPAELFPEGTSTSMRMFFFHAPNGRMLTTAGIRTTNSHLDEKKKGGLLVREILADHTLGPVYSIIAQPDDQKALEPQPEYTTSKDAGFLEACKQLLANHSYLEQQDFGVLLGKDRMNTYQGLDDKTAEDYGRAFCFYYRKDGTLAAIGKLGYEAVSPDNGKTWIPMPQATTLETGDAKVWLQKTSDGRYALVHNPQPTGKVRFPLVILDSEDGITFKNMRLLSGDFSAQRYAGNMRTPGVQYTRGVSIFANDGSRTDKDMFIAYSANKEDIWVSRIPIPLKLDETTPVSDRFDNGTSDASAVPNWNTYVPAWSAINIVDNPTGGKALQIKDGTPFDFAKAERVFPESKNPVVTFTLTPQHAGTLEIELRPAFGLARPVHLALAATGKLQAESGQNMTDLGTLAEGKPVTVSILANCGTSAYDVKVGEKVFTGLAFAQARGQSAASLTRLEFRTGSLRGAPVRNTNKNAEEDKPLASPAEFLISNVSVK